MAGPAWNSDPPGTEAVIAGNLPSIYTQLAAEAQTRPVPSLDLAMSWHQQLYDGVPVPSPSYIGNPRDTDPSHPDLIEYEVGVGQKQGVPSQLVPGELARFIDSLQKAVATFDQAFPCGHPPSNDTDVLAVGELMARAHSEWVRIHPYANGNGRTARIWANWIAVRYGLPPFVRIKPRPAGLLYERASAAAMGTPPSFQGDHQPTVAVFVDMLHAS